MHWAASAMGLKTCRKSAYFYKKMFERKFHQAARLSCCQVLMTWPRSIVFRVSWRSQIFALHLDVTPFSPTFNQVLHHFQINVGLHNKKTSRSIFLCLSQTFPPLTTNLLLQLPTFHYKQSLSWSGVRTGQKKKTGELFNQNHLKSLTPLEGKQKDWRFETLHRKHLTADWCWIPWNKKNGYKQSRLFSLISICMRSLLSELRMEIIDVEVKHV